VNASRVGWLVATLLLATGCTSRRRCGSRPEHPSTTTNPYVFYNDGETGSIVGGRRDNVFDAGAVYYDVRDLACLRGAVEVILLRLPDLAREFGATHADLWDRRLLLIVGPPRAHALVREVIAMLRASPGPRGPPAADR